MGSVGLVTVWYRIPLQSAAAICTQQVSRYIYMVTQPPEHTLLYMHAYICIHICIHAYTHILTELLTDCIIKYLCIATRPYAYRVIIGKFLVGHDEGLIITLTIDI